MKKQILLLLLLLNTVISAYSQNSYDITFASDINDAVIGFSKGYEDEYTFILYKKYWAGIYDTSDVTRFKIYSFYNNLQDSLCWPVNFYRPDTNIFPETVYFDSLYYFVFGSCVIKTNGSDTSLTRYEYMAEFNLNKQMLWERFYPRSTELSGFWSSGSLKVLKLISGNFLIITTVPEIGSPVERWLLREYSRNGDIIKERIFSDYLTGDIQSLTYGFDSSEILIHSSTGHIPSCNNLLTAGVGALILDTINYDTIGGICYLPNFDILYPYEAKFNDHAQLVVSGETFIYDFNQHKEDEYIGTYILNSDFQVIKSKLLTDKDRKTWVGNEKSMDINDDGNIFVAGEVDWVPYFWPQTYDYIYIAKMDSNLNLLTERYLGGDSFYGIMSMIVTSDEGIAFGGYKYDYKVNNYEHDAFVIKTDPDLWVRTGEHSAIPVHSALVYPNPGMEKINIRSTERGARFVLYSLTGKQVRQTTLENHITTMDCSVLPSGVYAWKLIKNNRVIDHGKWVKF